VAEATSANMGISTSDFKEKVSRYNRFGGMDATHVSVKYTCDRTPISVGKTFPTEQHVV
jgi:hypothetical protein